MIVASDLLTAVSSPFNMVAPAGWFRSSAVSGFVDLCFVAFKKQLFTARESRYSSLHEICIVHIYITCLFCFIVRSASLQFTYALRKARQSEWAVLKMICCFIWCAVFDVYTLFYILEMHASWNPVILSNGHQEITHVSINVLGICSQPDELASRKFYFFRK